MFRKTIILCMLFILIAGLMKNDMKADSSGIRLKLATTTSTENSGLLNKLIPPFEEMFKLKVDVIAVGTGKALRMGKDGDADVLLVHAPEAEKKFVSSGYGVNRRRVMYNDFVIIGPVSDPSNIKGLKAADAFSNLGKGQSIFVSRGDDSGTHKKEKAIWKSVGIKPLGDWYLEAGQGMASTAFIANEKLGYCLIDRGTYLFIKDKMDLVILSQNDDKYYNQYSVIAVNPARYRDTNYIYAMAFIGWVTSPAGQDIIDNYTINSEKLFKFNAF